MKEQVIELSEHQIQNQIQQYLVLAGFIVIRFNSGGVPAEHTNKQGKTKKRFTRFYIIVNFIKTRFCSSGLADILAIKDSRIKFFEVKRNRKCYQTPAQKGFQNLCKRFNTEYYIVYSLDEVIKLIENGKEPETAEPIPKK